MLATPEGVRHPHVVVPLAETGGDLSDQTASLSFDSGVSRLTLRADGDLEGLLEADFSEPLPTVWATEHSVHVDYPLGSRLLRRTGANTMRINPRLPWAIDVHGGTAHLAADLSGADVRSVAVHAGTAHADLVLGHPGGTCTIRLSSCKDLRIRRPGDVPVRLEIAKGATKVTLDDRHVGAVGGGLTDQTPGYETAEARYLVLVSGGADTLTVTS